MTRPIRLGVYADVDANLIDGSSIWLQSLVEVLNQGARTQVKLILKTPEHRDVITGRLRELKRVELVDPVDLRRGKQALGPTDVVRVLEQLELNEKFDAIFVRGKQVASHLSEIDEFKNRLWVYYLPPPDGQLESADIAELRRMAESCQHILCQTEQIRVLLEGAVPELSRKLLLLPPMIPEFESRAATTRSGPAKRIIYVGKFSADYRFLEMIQLFRELREEIPELELHVAGDKIHNPYGSQSFDVAVQDALERTPGLVWHGGISRREVQDLLRKSDVALSLRDSKLDRSLELSTKVLEYGAKGVPVVLNRSPLYEDLLGTDYPLFVDTPGQATEILRSALLDAEIRFQASVMCERASKAFTISRTWARLRPTMERIAPVSSCLWVPKQQSLRILAAGHDMKFFDPIKEYLRAAGAEVREDHWEGHDTHDEARSRQMLDWAHVIICEWCLGNAVWYSENKQDAQAMIIRLHRVEMESPYPGMVNFQNIDRVVFVANHIQQAVSQKFDWSHDKLQVIPNAVDIHMLQREKLPGYQFNLGLLGYIPKLKRLDRALDILELLRTQDRRFHLHLKGHAPWQLDWVWHREHEFAYYERVFSRLENSPILSGAVSFEPFGSDVASWLRKIGFLLSTSDIEGNQVAVAEAMASGSVPVVLERPGASDTYPTDYVHADAAKAATEILTAVRDDRFKEQAQTAREFAISTFAPTKVTRLWDELICETAKQRIETADSER